MTSNDSPTSASVVSTHVVEAVVAACVLGLGLVVIFGSWNLGSGWTSDGPGAGYFPFYIGLILCVAACGIFYQAVFGKERDTGPFVNKEQLSRVLQVLLPALVYVGAIQLIGLYVASAIYIALFMVILGKFSWIKSISAALVINAVFFMMFEVWFKVPLFKGSLNPLSFLGY